MLGVVDQTNRLADEGRGAVIVPPGIRRIGTSSCEPISVWMYARNECSTHIVLDVITITVTSTISDLLVYTSSSTTNRADEPTSANVQSGRSAASSTFIAPSGSLRTSSDHSSSSELTSAMRNSSSGISGVHTSSPNNLTTISASWTTAVTRSSATPTQLQTSRGPWELSLIKDFLIPT
jgi:hypothetical protein